MVSTKALMALTIVFTALVVIIVSVRLWARRKSKLPLGVDDVCAIIAALLFIVVYTIPVLISCIADDLGAHVPITPSGQPVPPSRSFDATHFTYWVFGVLPLGFAKCSTLFLYRRIFRGKAFSVITWAVIGLVIAWTVSFFLALLLQCLPVTVSTLHLARLKCIDAVPVTRALGTSAVITDFIIMVIPWPFVWPLQMKVRQKLAVIGIFLLGALTIAASLARCVVIFSTVRDINRSVIDYTYSNGENSFWAVAECALAIISSCLPTMGHVLRVWTLKLDVRTWTRSFTCGCTAGSHGADEGKDSTSSCAHLRDPGSKDLPRHASKTSTTNTHEEDEKPCVSGFPEEGIVVSTTVEQSDDLV